LFEHARTTIARDANEAASDVTRALAVSAAVLSLPHRASDRCRRLGAGRRFNRRSDQVMKLVAASLSITLIFGLAGVSRAATDEDAHKIIRQHLHQLLPADQIGGITVAIRMDGRTVFFDSGLANVAKKLPVTSDSLFNLASISKVFDATLLALLAKQGEISFDDPVADYVTELQRGGDIRRVTLGQLATHTAGLNLPPEGTFTLPKFIRYLNRWTADRRSSRASSSSIRTRATCCFISRSNAGSVRRTRSCWKSVFSIE